MKVKKGDKVLVIKGKDRGKSGKIIRVLPGQMKIIVEGLNLVRRSTKPKKQGEKGQIVLKENGLRVENIKLLCPSCNEPTKIGSKREGQNKMRICKKCGATI